MSESRVLTFEDCGRFLAEEAPERILPAPGEFMGTPRRVDTDSQLIPMFIDKNARAPIVTLRARYRTGGVW